jgi:hypothetical protein
MSRRRYILLMVTTILCVLAPPAGATESRPLSRTLADLWTTVLETPAPQNPFGSGDDTCFELRGNVVAPFGPKGADTCTVKHGTRIFVAASTYECSTFAGDLPGVKASEAELQSCARENDLQVSPTVTVDGQPTAVTEVKTGPLSMHLPKANIFGLAGKARYGHSAAHGWVVLLHPLKRGLHTIIIEGSVTITTTIVVK